MTKPFLKYPGAKTRHLPKINKLLTPAECLVDVFTGSGAVFLGTDFPTYICADINPHLINMFNYVKRDVEGFIRHTKPLCVDANNEKSRYYEFREEFNTTDDIERQSHLFYYLIHTCFNGLVRWVRLVSMCLLVR